METVDQVDHPHRDHADHGHQEEHAEHGEHEHEESLLEELHERLIEVKSMSWELKGFTILGAVVVLALAVFALLRNELHGMLVTSQSFSEDGDSNASLSQIVFFSSVIFVCLGWSLVTTAAARAGWLTRIACLGGLAIAFGPERTSVTWLNTTSTLIGAAMLGLIVLIIVLTWFPERRIHDEEDPKKISAERHWRWMRKLVFPMSLLIFLALYGLVWHESNATGFSDNFPQTMADQLSNIQWLLIPIITLAGADLGDWSSFAAGHAIRRFRDWLPLPAFAAFCVVVAGAIGVDGIIVSRSDSGDGLVPELILGGIIAAVAAYALMISKPMGSWPKSYQYLCVVAVAAVDSAVQYVLNVVITNDPNGYHFDGWEDVFWLAVSVLGLILITTMRGKLPDWLMLACIFSAILGVVLAATDFYELTTVINPLHWAQGTGPWVWYEGIKATAAIITVGTVLLAAATGRLRDWTEPILMLLRATVALQVVQWIDDIYGGAVHSSGAAKAGGQMALAAAVVLVLALSWEFATSGESITNGHRLRFPRDSRVMLFIGYILVTATTSVFFSNIGEMQDGKWHLLESQFEAETYVQQGLEWLGIALVTTIFVISFNRWREERAAGHHEPSPEPLPAALARHSA